MDLDNIRQTEPHLKVNIILDIIVTMGRLHYKYGDCVTREALFKRLYFKYGRDIVKSLPFFSVYVHSMVVNGSLLLSVKLNEDTVPEIYLTLSKKLNNKETLRDYTLALIKQEGMF